MLSENYFVIGFANLLIKLCKCKSMQKYACLAEKAKKKNEVKDSIPFYSSVNRKNNSVTQELSEGQLSLLYVSDLEKLLISYDSKFLHFKI